MRIRKPEGARVHQPMAAGAVGGATPRSEEGPARAAFHLPVRILFVVNVDWFFLSHRLPIARAARDAGAEVIVAAGDTGRGEEIEREGIKFVPLEISRGGTHLGREVRAVRELLRLYRRLRPALVHHVTIKPILYGSLAARLVPGTGAVNAISGLGYVFTKDVRAGMLRSLIRPLYRLALRNRRSRTIFQNPDDLAYCLSSGLVHAGQTVLIRGSGVDCSHFVLRPEAAGPPLVVLSSRMLWDKGVGDFVQAARLVREDFPEARFALVGAADPDNPKAVPKAQLRSWSEEEGIVEWWGFRRDIVDVLQQSSVVVLPSRYPEGVPKSLIEAAAVGRAIVATDTPGCREIVRDGENGLLVPPGDVPRLADAIGRLLADPIRRQQFGQSGRELVEREFAVEIVVEKTMHVYAELLRSLGHEGCGVENVPCESS